MSENSGEGRPAGWEPDPTGRHEFRYWDGSAWTDNVADGGATTTDPYEETAPEPAPVAPAPAAPAAPAPAAPPPPSPPQVVYTPALPTGTTRGRSKAPLIGVIAAVVVAVGVAAFLLLGGDDGDSGTGKSTVEVPGGGTVTRQVSIGPDQVLLVRVNPQADDVDPIIGLSFDPDADGADDLSSYYDISDSDPFTDDPSEFSDLRDRPDPIVDTHNQSGPGEEEGYAFPFPFDLGTITLVFGDASGEGGKLDVDIRVIDLKAPDEVADYDSLACENPEFSEFDRDFDIVPCDGSDETDGTDGTDESS